MDHSNAAIMNPIARRFMLAAIAAGLVGMCLGIYMGTAQDFRFAHVHAHVNLLGWVSLTLYALFYQAVPAAAVGRLPHLHFGVATIGPAMMCAALANPAENHGGLTPVIAIGALMTLASMISFGFVVVALRGAQRARAVPAAS